MYNFNLQQAEKLLPKVASGEKAYMLFPYKIYINKKCTTHLQYT